MPRFFFHVHDGRDELDRTGRELEDWNAARRHAIQRAGQILDSTADRLELGELWYMEVADADGLTLFRLDFHVTLSPALIHEKALSGKLP